MGDAYERGLICYRQERYAQAASEFRRELLADAGSSPAHAMLGLTLLSLGDHAGADAEVHEAVRTGPDQPFVHYALACHTLRRPAARWWERAVRRHPYVVRRRTAAAREQVREAVRLNPSSADYHNLLGACAFDLGDWGEAEASLRQGLAVDAGHAPCATLLARILAASGRQAEADRMLAGVLARDPSFAPAHLARGWSVFDRGDASGAINYVRESLRLDPTQAAAGLALSRMKLARWPVVGNLVRVARRIRSPRGQRALTWAAGAFGVPFGASVLCVGMNRSGEDRVDFLVGVAAIAIVVFVARRPRGRRGTLRSKVQRSSH